MRSAVFLLACLLLPAQLHAESFEEYKRRVSSDFQEYKDARDKEFVDFLKKQWSEFQGFKGVPRYQEPKPRVIPPAPRKPVAKAPPAAVVAPAQPPVTPPAQAKEPPRIVGEPVKPLPPVAVPPQPVLPLDPNKKIAEIEYFGASARFAYDPKTRQPLAVLNQDGISRYWSELSKTDYDPLLAQLREQQKRLKLNDWGTFLLIDKLARQINAGQERESVLLSWFLLAKLGYDCKVGYNDQRVYLMVAVSHMVYQTAFFKDDRKTYYCLDSSGRLRDVGRLYSFKGSYPDANRELTFAIPENPLLPATVKTRKLSFSYDNHTYDIEAEYEPALVAYYEHYPQSDYPVYFTARVNDAATSALLAQLAPLVKGRSEQDATNLLLRFVQTAFQYQTDEQQFNYEKVMLPEETLYYPYSDCEDRAILFAYLVRNLLDLRVVALLYPGHLATAVALPGKTDGDVLSYKGTVYTVADPTYINANIGMAMPQFRNSQYKVIEM